jgi:hypothetical protein
VYRVLYGEIVSKDLMNATFFNAVTGVEVKADYWIVFHYLYIRYMPLCSIFILMMVMACVLGIFLGFHLYITSKNMTTNEVSDIDNVCCSGLERSFFHQSRFQKLLLMKSSRVSC